MAAPAFNVEIYSDALVVLGTAGILVPLVRRWGLSPVLAYLGAGAALGPLGLGSLKGDFPFLYWLTIVDARNVAGIADLGVVFLLFIIGLRLSFQRLLTLRRLVFGLGSLQVVISAAILAALCRLGGLGAATSVLVGACLALSSTAFVLDVLANEKRLASSAGRAAFAVLLAQDLAVIPILFLVSVLEPGGSALAGVAVAMGNAALAFGAIVVIGRLLLRPLFRLVAASGMTELFVAAVLFVVVGTAMAAGLAGMSMALGAFVAGLILAETEYVKAIEAAIDPFRGLLLGIFFFTVGMDIDPRAVAREPLLLVGAVGGLIAVKLAIAAPLARLFGQPWPAAAETGLLLAPGGEFALVVIGLAASIGVIDARLAAFALSVVAVSMVLIPVLAALGRRISSAAAAPVAVDPALAVEPRPAKGHAIIVGYGRVGLVVATLLRQHQFPFIAIDNDADVVTLHRKQVAELYYGDAATLSFLTSCGLMDAAAVIVTSHSPEAIDQIVRMIRLYRPDILVVARARDAEHARHLYRIGVSDAVPETIEASLQLSEALLIGLGVPMGLVIASIHEMRDGYRSELQDAARKAGNDTTPVSARKPLPRARR